jgi:hypothetical protein
MLAEQDAFAGQRIRIRGSHDRMACRGKTFAAPLVASDEKQVVSGRHMSGSFDRSHRT